MFHVNLPGCTLKSWLVSFLEVVLGSNDLDGFLLLHLKKVEVLSSWEPPQAPKKTMISLQHLYGPKKISRRAQRPQISYLYILIVFTHFACILKMFNL